MTKYVYLPFSLIFLTLVWACEPAPEYELQEVDKHGNKTYVEIPRGIPDSLKQEAAVFYLRCYDSHRSNNNSSNRCLKATTEIFRNK